MKRSRERTSTTNWVFNIAMIALFTFSILYMALYWWPHSQGRPSPLDQYAPAGRAFLAKLGLVNKATVAERNVGGKAAQQTVTRGAIRSAILGDAEWINFAELDDVQVNGRNATVLVRARMTSSEALTASRDIFGACFSKVAGLSSLRVVTRVKGRSAAESGRWVDKVCSDISMSRATYSALDWSSVTPHRLPKVADRAKLY